MSVGILYESQEWSSFKIHSDVERMGVSAELIDMQQDIDLQKLHSFDLLVSRVFASSVFRGHEKSLEQMPAVIDFCDKNKIPMINPTAAHSYEISKAASTAVLKTHGIDVPEVYGVFTPNQLLSATNIEYPCVVKPDCGGRSNCTFIIHSRDELVTALKDAPNLQYIVQQYISPIYGYLTRIEVIDGSCKLILKRSVTESGLSSYNLGSTYEHYSDCSENIKNTAVKAMDILFIESGSMDIIESDSGFYIIDINSVSNASEDNTEMFGFDLMLETAKYIVKRHDEIIGG